MTRRCVRLWSLQRVGSTMRVPISPAQTDAQPLHYALHTTQNCGVTKGDVMRNPRSLNFACSLKTNVHGTHIAIPRPHMAQELVPGTWIVGTTIDAA